MRRLLNFWSLTGRERQFFFEAGILLLFSSLAVKTISFRHIESFLRRRWSQIITWDSVDNDINLVKLSLTRAANVLPWKSLCLSRSIAGYVMLRRRGIPAAILAGVKVRDDSSLHAHAWIRAGDLSIGHSENCDFTAVLRIGPLIANSIAPDSMKLICDDHSVLGSRE
jgi:hypothetical protein